jgi:hypothetical protein
MNTSHLRRTTVSASALAAALTLLTVVHAPTANAMLAHDPGPATSAHSTWLQIDEIVTIRKVAAAQNYVDHASELNLY